LEGKTESKSSSEKTTTVIPTHYPIFDLKLFGTNFNIEYSQQAYLLFQSSRLIIIKKNIIH